LGGVAVRVGLAEFFADILVRLLARACPAAEMSVVLRRHFQAFSS
jgi:hypothetical protein